MAELLNVQDLRVHFHIAAKGHNAVDGVSFSLGEGEILGLVGESGSGKSVTAMSISGLLPRRQAEVSGSIKLGGREILQCPEEELRKIQGDDLAVVFQEPMTSLNPVVRVGPQVEESLRVHTRLSPEARRQRALEAMTQAELPDPEGLYRKYPHELSGGMLQRPMVAAAIISEPKLLICDEPTSALDPVGRKEILDILMAVREQTTVLFSTHILSDVERICTDVAFLNDGVVNIQGKLSDIKSQYRTEEYVLETGKEEELKLLMNVFAGLKKSGMNTASFRENDHTLFDILRFVTDNRIRLLKIERVEPTLETLFMEVVEK